MQNSRDAEGVPATLFYQLLLDGRILQLRASIAQELIQHILRQTRALVDGDVVCIWHDQDLQQGGGGGHRKSKILSCPLDRSTMVIVSAVVYLHTSLLTLDGISSEYIDQNLAPGFCHRW